MAVNDVYQVTALGQVGGFDMSNVFWYLQLTGVDDPTNAAVLAGLFDTVVMADLVPLQVANITWNQLRVINMRLYGTDFDEYTPANDVGTNGGSPGANAVAFGYRLNRRAPGQSSGFKRFAGAADEDINGNTWTPWNTAPATALEVSLSTVLTSGSTQFAPVVVVHSKKAVPTYKIEYGTNPTVSFQFLSATALTVVTSQNSRKRPNVN